MASPLIVLEDAQGLAVARALATQAHPVLGEGMGIFENDQEIYGGPQVCCLRDADREALAALLTEAGCPWHEAEEHWPEGAV